MEAIFNTFAADNTSPVAVRAPAPGPLVNPITPTVRITGIDGAATPAEPDRLPEPVDMIVDAPGVIQVDLATTDVPAGTDVEVTVKPKVGAPPVSQNVTLAAGSCASGACRGDELRPRRRRLHRGGARDVPDALTGKRRTDAGPKISARRRERLVGSLRIQFGSSVRTTSPCTRQPSWP